MRKTNRSPWTCPDRLIAYIFQCKSLLFKLFGELHDYHVDCRLRPFVVDQEGNDELSYIPLREIPSMICLFKLLQKSHIRDSSLYDNIWFQKELKGKNKMRKPLTKEILKSELGERFQKWYELENTIEDTKEELRATPTEDRVPISLEIERLARCRERIIEWCGQYMEDHDIEGDLVYLFADFVDYKLTGEVLDENLQWNEPS